MSKLIAFLKSKNITSHTVAALAISAATLISTDEQVRTFLVGAFVHHPKIATEIIALASIILKYSRGSSPTGAVTEVAKDTPVPVLIAPETKEPQ